MNLIKRIFVLSVIVVAGQETLLACPSCYGAPDSPLTAGMNAAILVMLGITGFVLMSIVGCFLFLWRRAKRHQEMLSLHMSVNEHGNLEEKNDKGVMEWNNF